MADQILTLVTPDANLNIAQQFVVTVRYNVSDNNINLSGLGFRVHFDNTELRLDNFTTSFGTGADPIAETVTDADADTNFQFTYTSNPGGNFPGQALPQNLATLTFTTLAGFDGSALNVTFSNTAPTYTGVGAPLTLRLEDPVVTPNQVFNYRENQAAANFVIGKVAATDDVAVTGFRIDSINGDDNDPDAGAFEQFNAFFAIAANGDISLTAAGAAANVATSDFETAPNQFILGIIASDANANNSASVNVTVNVTDVDDTAPVVTANQTFSYQENRAAGFQIGRVAATDAVGVTGFAINTINGDDNDNDNGAFEQFGAFFAIAANGNITLTAAGAIAAANDFETDPNQFVLGITARDAANNVSAAPVNVTLNVTNVDEIAPVVTGGQVFNYQENQANGATIGRVAATDAVGVTGFTITPATNPNGFFAIDAAGNITLTAAGAIAAANDFETGANQFVLGITARDAAGNVSAAVNVTLNVTDRDEDAPVVTGGQVFNYQENRTVGHLVGGVVAAGGAVSYAIVSGNESNFFAIAADGSITLTAAGAALGSISNDFEALPNQFRLGVTATDAAGNTSAPSTITINVTDQDEIAPIVGEGQTFNYQENRAAGFQVGRVAATDAVGVTGFNIASGNANRFFAIDATGSLTLTATGAAAAAASNNFEITPNTFTLGITASDAVGNTSNPTNVVISVTDVDDTNPVVTPAQIFSYAENQAPGFVIGTVAATDNVGVTGFTINGGNGGGFFAINNAGILSLTGAGAAGTANNFDDGNNTFTLQVVAIDAGGSQSPPTNVIVNVTDIDDVAPVVTPNQVFGYDENRSANFQIGTVAANDSVGVVSYAIASGNTEGFFAINSNGVLTLTATGAAAGSPANDFETAPNQFILGITATDAAGNTSTAGNVTLNVANREDIAPVIDPATPIQVTYSENRPLGFQIVDVNATDNVAVTGFNIASGNANGFFAIDAAGILTLTATGSAAGSAANDFETSPNTFALGITAVDAANNISAPFNITVRVTDVEDTPPVIAPNQTFSYIEGQAANFTIGTVGATDNTNNVTRFAIASGNSSGFFAISNAGVLTLTATGAAINSAANDFETGLNQFTLGITATDGTGNVSPVTNVIVNVTNKDDSAPVVAENQTFRYEEGQTTGYQIGTVTATDDVAVTGFNITTGNEAGFFALDNAGNLTLTTAGAAAAAASNDFETVPNTFSLQVTARDAVGNTSLTRDISISLTDRDEQKPVVAAGQVFNYVESQSAGFQIGAVAATDNVAVVSYAIASGNADGFFAINAAGNLTLTEAGVTAAANDFETAPNAFTLGITATDAVGNISDPVNVTVNVLDLPSLTIVANDAAAAEELRDPGQFTLTLSQAPVAPITVNYTVSGTSVAADYTEILAGTITFGIGTTTRTLDVTPVNDLLVEGAETVQITVGAGTGYELGATTQATVTIADNEAPPALIATIAATDANASEEGQDPGRFTFSLSQAQATPITLNYLVRGTASATDYTDALTGTVTIPAGQTSRSIDVTPVNDSLVEAAETIIVALDAGTNYTLGAATTATVTIADNDFPTVTIAVTDAVVSEEALDQGQFTLTLSQASAADVTVNYTVSGTVDLDDYEVLTGSVTIPAGQTTGLIPVIPVQDTFVEGNEILQVTLGTGDNYSLGGVTQASLIITDNDTSPITATIAATDADAAEEGLDAGEFTITLSQAAPAGGLIVSYATSGTATDGDDYTALPGTVTIDQGETSATIAVTPLNDDLPDEAETVIATLIPGTGYGRGIITEATVTIADNDVAAITASIAPTDPTAAEEGLNPGEFTVTLSDVAPQGGITVSYAVAGTATPVDDYAVLTGTVTIAAGETSATIAVTPVDDIDVELGIEQTVEVSIIAGVGYTLGATTQATVTIADNDAVVIPPTATIAATDNAASEQPGNPGQFTVTLSEAPTADLELAYTVAGTATSGTDYTALSGTVTVLAGATTATIAVLPVEDADDVEGNQSVIVTLTDGAAYDLGAVTEATVTIADSVITDIDGNTDINDADIALIVDYLLGATPDDLQSTFNQYSSSTGGASNTTGNELVTSIDAQLSLFDIDGSGETTTADIFVINSYLLFQQSFNGNRPAIENQLGLLAQDLSVELNGPNTTGPGLYTALNALFA